MGEVSPVSGSSDARRSHQPGDIPSPCSKSIGSRKYKTHAEATDEFILCRTRFACSEKLPIGAERLIEPRDQRVDVDVDALIARIDLALGADGQLL